MIFAPSPLRWLDRLPGLPLTAGALLLGLAPFVPQPHLWEKLKMLAGGTLHAPLDIFDLLLHAALPLLLGLKLLRRGGGDRAGRKQGGIP